MKNHKARCVALILLLFHLLTSSPLSAGEPTEQLRSAVDKIFIILQDPDLKPEGRRKERRDRLRQVIYPKFSFAEMAKRSLGSHWPRRSSLERREFVKIFTDFWERTYVGRIESYNGGKTVYTREIQDGHYAEVDTKIVVRKGEKFPVNYKLHFVDGNWKVYDLVIESISIVNNYRSQFHRILATSSFDDLLKRLQERRAEEFGSHSLKLDLSPAYLLLLARPRVNPKP